MEDNIPNRFTNANPFWPFLGLGIDDIKAQGGEAWVKLAMRPDLFQHQGVVHGGVVSALIDSEGRSIHAGP